ncbi:MAG: hypothetical protein WCP24_00760 [bacterium]
MLTFKVWLARILLVACIATAIMLVVVDMPLWILVLWGVAGMIGFALTFSFPTKNRHVSSSFVFFLYTAMFFVFAAFGLISLGTACNRKMY